MIKAIYPGTFDPITIGHLDVIKRAAAIYDHLIVAIMENKSKKCTFNEEERKALIEKCLVDLPNVEVVIGEGLTIELAKKLNCKVLVRGIRAVTDYESELAIASANMALDPSIETLFLVSKPELSFVSSSIVKEIASFNGDISKYIPLQIKEDIYAKLYK